MSLPPEALAASVPLRPTEMSDPPELETWAVSVVSSLASRSLPPLDRSFVALALPITRTSEPPDVDTSSDETVTTIVTSAPPEADTSRRSPVIVPDDRTSELPEALRAVSLGSVT